MQQDSGFILINKPVGPTSYGIISILRGITGIKKIGHAGTLDPKASGLLIVAIGREATREIDKYVKLDKEYIAEIDLSATTDTYDSEGKITKKFQEREITESELAKVLRGFLGKQEQIPPMFSAKKVGGKKLYDLARAGKEIERQPSSIEIYKIKLLKYLWPILKIKVEVSSGTYIRSLAVDIGATLKVGGYLKTLERTKIGKFKLTQAKPINIVTKANWQNFLFK